MNFYTIAIHECGRYVMSEAILTYSSEFYKTNYSRKTSIVDEYRKNVLLYLVKLFPTVDASILVDEVQNIIKEYYKPAQLNYLELESPCNVAVKSGDLLEITNKMNTDILSPYGATYCQVSERKALFSEYIQDKQAERKVVKKDMFKADAAGDKQLVRMKNLSQMNIKIGINVLSGVMLSSVTFRSAINYNAITATSRFSVMTAYAAVELIMASNYYFHNEDAAINWITNLLRIYPGDVRFSRCIDQYKLAIPSVDRVFSAYAEQVNIYSKLSNNLILEQLVSKLSDLERAFVYYGMNFKRIIQDNDSFHSYFDNMLDVENIQLIEGDIPKVAKLKDELIQTFTVITLSDLIDKIIITDEKTGKTRKASLSDIDDAYPELARRIYSTYMHLEKELKKLEFLFENLIMLPMMPSDIGMHKNMIRRTVLLSDTDSILFTNMDWVEWYQSSIKITTKSSRFNAAIITLISKILEHVFAYMSASMNVGLANIRTIAIKNEFMYDLFLRTPISKHYAGYVRYREGAAQIPYKFDLKGKNFKGSDLCRETTTYVKWFIKNVFDGFLETYELHPEDLIMKVITLEQRIKRSIDLGEVTFLTQKPINLKEGYKLPESSNYLYYELWQAIFAEKYGDLNLPQKTKELPIVEVSVDNLSQLHYIKTLDEGVYERFVAFITKYPKRKFARVLIPMDLEIPQELRAIANYRKVCSANCYSLDLILRSFNIVNFTHSKDIILFSDTYPELLKEITDDYRKFIAQEVDKFDDQTDEEFEEEDGDDDEVWDQTWESDN